LLDKYKDYVSTPPQTKAESEEDTGPTASSPDDVEPSGEAEETTEKPQGGASSPPEVEEGEDSFDPTPKDTENPPSVTGATRPVTDDDVLANGKKEDLKPGESARDSSGKGTITRQPDTVTLGSAKDSEYEWDGEWKTVKGNIGESMASPLYHYRGFS
jgi:hypothetical protein